MNTFEMLDADASLLPPNARVLVAVSGGADSMALLHWLLDLKRDLVVGHVNHGLDELRGGQCARDEAWLRARCIELNAAFSSETIALPRSNGHVNEAVARQGRYGALERLARKNGCAVVATAHTASDALEGVFLSLGRGASNLRGFAPCRELAPELELVRPFWRLGRDEVRSWLVARGAAWLEDESNQSPLFRRNRVRGELVPMLSSIFGREGDELARAFALNAALARDEDAWSQAQAREHLERLVLKREDGLVALDGLGFGELPVALGRRVVRLAAREVAPEVRDIERAKVEEVRRACIDNQRRRVWSWRKVLRVEWTGQSAGNRLRFWRV